MADRIISMRTLLRQNLEALGSPHRWGRAGWGGRVGWQPAAGSLCEQALLCIALERCSPWFSQAFRVLDKCCMHGSQAGRAGCWWAEGYRQQCRRRCVSGWCRSASTSLPARRLLFATRPPEFALRLAPACSWQHITDQIGMFCFTGLTPEQVRSSRQLPSRPARSSACPCRPLHAACATWPCPASRRRSCTDLLANQTESVLLLPSPRTSVL